MKEFEKSIFVDVGNDGRHCPEGVVGSRFGQKQILRIAEFMIEESREKSTRRG